VKIEHDVTLASSQEHVVARRNSFDTLIDVSYVATRPAAATRLPANRRKGDPTMLIETLIADLPVVATTSAV